MAIDVHVVTPEREVWAGTADMVAARGVEGEVGILSGHAPLLIRLAIGRVRIFTEGDNVTAVAVDGGFLHVTTDGGATRVDVLATQADLVDDVDPQRAAARVDEARRRVEEQDDEESRAELAKALARVDAAR